jgi:hypothetical protein
MRNLALDDNEKKLLVSLSEFKSIDIIWDLNAFYFNADKSTYKLESVDQTPESSDSFDEIVSCRFQKLEKYVNFKKNKFNFWKKTNYWYTLFEDCKIISIKIVDESEMAIAENKYSNDYCKLNLGIIIETNKGYFPAFLLPGVYGFQWQPKYDFYTQNEIEELVIENQQYIEINNCA